MSSEQKPVFAENLRFLIYANGYGFREFSRVVGVHYSLLKRYMSGSATPRPDRVRVLAVALGVTPGALVFEKLTPDTEQL
mgnify:CR=1 FL=1